MAVESNIREPEKTEGMLKGIAYLILAILPVLLIIAGFWNLSIASEMGERNGYDVPALFEQWRGGLDLTRRYSQSYLMAMERLSSAVFQLSTALLTACGGGVLLYANRRKKDRQ
jgi:hypothetical protein